MMKLSTPAISNGFRSGLFAFMVLFLTISSQKANAQTVTITADINWTCYSEENWVYIYTPDLSSYVYFCDPNHCYYNDNSNLSYVASNVNLGTLPYQCGQYLVRMYDAWPDNWNCGTGVTIKLNGISVGTFNKLNGAAAYQDAYFFPPAINQGFLNLSAAGAAGGVPSGCTETTMTIGHGQYRDLNLNANTWYDFTWQYGGSTNAFQANIIAGGSGSSGNFSTTPTNSWYSGSQATTLRFSANRSDCLASTTSSVLRYKNATPTIPNAGSDQTGAATCGTTQVTLGGNAITLGSGAWSIISGSGGNVTTPSSPTSTFTGVAGNQYTLRWTATNGTCALSDDVIIKFNRNPSTAAAGGDQTGASTCGLTAVTLAANTPAVGTGAWSTVPAGLGSFGNSTFPNSTFSGTAGSSYTLRWTITSPDAVCTSSFDDVLVTFNRNPTPANAGPDRTDLTTCGLTSLSLAANSPGVGTGVWTMIGAGSTPSPSNSPTANFSGSLDILYSLKWTISNSPCPSSSDTVNVRFNSIPVTTFSGLSSPYCVTSSPVALTPTVSGGNFSGPGVTGSSFNPAAAGPGTHNISYSFPLYSASSITYVAQPAGGTGIPLSDESISGTLPIGFSFNFQGTAYTQFAASSNGYITLGAGSNSNIPQVLPNAAAPNNLIAACWADLNPGVGGGGSVSYVTTGNAPNRKLVVNYVNVPFSANGTDPNVSTSIVLYESTDVVEIHTSNVNGSPGNATMGIENSSGTQATLVPGRNASNWSASNEGWRFTPATPCPSVTSQSVEVKALPSVANAGPDQTGVATCGLTSVSLAGNAPSVGTGVWSIIAGTGGSIVTSSSPTSTFNGVAGNTYTLRWTISNAPCTTSFDDVIITFSPNPTASNAGPDLTGASTCGLTSISLAGNTPAIGTGEWSIINGTGGSITSPANAASAFSGIAGNTYTLRWTISNAPCTASTDDVIITFNQNPTTSNAGTDQTDIATCGLTEVTLSGNTPAVGTGAWSIISGSGGNVTSSGNSSSTFTGTAGATYTLRWTISNSPCTASQDDVQVTFNQNPTAANAGTDQIGASTCGLTSVNLAGNNPSIGTGAWTILSGTGGTVDNPSSPSSSFSGSAGSSYLLRWTITNSPCTATFDDVSVTFNINPTTSNAGSDLTGASTCGVNNVTLGANTATSGTGAWSIVSGAGGNFQNAALATSKFFGTPGNSYTLRWTISNSPCTASTDDLIVTFNRNPTIAHAGSDLFGAATCNIDTVTLSGNTPSVGTGSWSIESGIGGALVNPSSPNSKFSGADGTTYTLRWTISNPPCNASNDFVSVTFSTSPDASFNTLDSAYCINASPIPLTPTTLGGSFSGAGVAGGNFDPSIAGVGNHSVTYTLPPYSISSITFDTLTTAGAFPVFLGDEDIVVPTLPSGFNFNFYGNQYNSFEVSSNGYITFTTGTGQTGCCAGQQIPNPLAPNNIIAPAWSDLDPSSGGSVSCSTVGSAPNRKWVITYSGISFFGTGTPDVTTQVILYETTNVIEFHTSSITNSPGGVTMGIENAAGTLATVIPGRDSGLWSASNEAWRFAPGCSGTSSQNVIVKAIPTTAAAGNDQTPVCGVTQISLAGNTANAGTGLWSIESGSGGSLVDETNPTSAFNGVPGNSYTLRWTISNTPCSASFDDMVVTFLPIPVWYRDFDQDLYSNGDTLHACAQPANYYSAGSLTAISGDCDDNNQAINPAALEVCNGVDDNCDGLIDDNDPSVIGQGTYYADVDGDGYGTGTAILACVQPANTSTNSLDCNDTIAAINPGVVEICNGIDDDCDGLTDDNDPSIFGQGTYYTDADTDGYGTGTPILACIQPANTAINDDDCDDNDAAVNPAAIEVCNGIDDECDGLTDDSDPSVVGQGTYYADGDADGFGTGSAILACIQPSNTSLNNTDCDDTDGSIHPGAAEVCNGIDDDCDGTADDGVLLTFYFDADNDGFGDASSTIQACSPPVGYVVNGNDCNDSNSAIHPGAAEVCNGIDDNCNGQIDEGNSRPSTFYADADGDGFGNAAVTIEACSAPPGYVTNRTDCDDNNPAVHPDATEICNGIDDNCKRGIDEDSKPDRPQSISGPTVVCKNATGIVYSTPSVAGVTVYNWTVTNGTIVSGQGTDTIIVNWSNKNGKVKVSLTNNCGTSQEEFVNVSAINCNAKQNMEDEESAQNEIAEFRIKVYPNPFSDVFHLKVSGLEEDNLSIRIYDVLGQLIENRISVPFESDITFGSTLAKGVYLLEVNQGDKVQVIRIVKSE